MRRFSKLFIAAALIAFAGACTADVEDPGEAPEINIEGGEAPEIDVDPAEINISADTQTVVVPDVDIEAREP